MWISSSIFSFILCSAQFAISSESSSFTDHQQKIKLTESATIRAASASLQLDGAQSNKADSKISNKTLKGKRAGVSRRTVKSVYSSDEKGKGIEDSFKSLKITSSSLSNWKTSWEMSRFSWEVLPPLDQENSKYLARSLMESRNVTPTVPPLDVQISSLNLKQFCSRIVSAVPLKRFQSSPVIMDIISEFVEVTVKDGSKEKILSIRCETYFNFEAGLTSPIAIFVLPGRTEYSYFIGMQNESKHSDTCVPLNWYFQWNQQQGGENEMDIDEKPIVNEIITTAEMKEKYPWEYKFFTKFELDDQQKQPQAYNLTNGVQSEDIYFQMSWGCTLSDSDKAQIKFMISKRIAIHPNDNSAGISKSNAKGKLSKCCPMDRFLLAKKKRSPKIIVGFVWLKANEYVNENVGEIHNFAIDTNFQHSGAGLAESMLKVIEKLSKSAEIKKIKTRAGIKETFYAKLFRSYDKTSRFDEGKMEKKL